MGEISEIFQQFGDEYINIFKDRIPHNHVKAIRRIQNCRTISNGVNLYSCSSCTHKRTVYRGCGSRNCPNCQEHKTQKWLSKRLEEALPGPHFMVTFTIPAELRSFFKSHQAKAYSALFKASSQTLQTLIADPKFVGADISGFFGVLHTWGRQLQYHPHIHYIVPGGGIDTKTKLWKKSSPEFLVHVKALSKLFRGKLKAIFKKEGLLDEIDPSTWFKEFNVNSQALKHNNEGAVKYLAPYVFKIAISDCRIISCEKGKVTFSYIKKGSRRKRRMTLDVMEFIRRYLQHVLPDGFMKVRYYGFMSPNSKVSTDEIRCMIELAYSFEISIKPRIIKLEHPHVKCCKCGKPMKLIESIFAYEISST